MDVTRCLVRAKRTVDATVDRRTTYHFFQIQFLLQRLLVSSEIGFPPIVPSTLPSGIVILLFSSESPWGTGVYMSYKTPSTFLKKVSQPHEKFLL